MTSDLSLLTLSVFILQVSGGTVRDLLAGLRSVGECRALSVLEEALCRHHHQETTTETTGEQTLTSPLLSRDLSVHLAAVTMTTTVSTQRRLSLQVKLCALRFRI